MADVERERVTALWREASAALSVDALAKRIAEHLGYCPHSTAEDEAAGAAVLYLLAECERLREQLDTARQALTDELEQKAEAVIRASALRRQRDAVGDYIASALTSLETGPDKDAYAYALLCAARAALGVEGEQE